MIVASNLAALGAPDQDGVLGIIRVGAWPDVVDVRLRWHADQLKWVGEPMLIIQSMDPVFMTTNDPDWSYISSFTGGFSGGNAIRTVRNASTIWNTGLRLQDRQQFRGMNTTAGRTFTVAPWFYQFDDGDFIEFANDVGVVTWPSGSGISIDDPPSGTVRPTDGTTTFQAENLNNAHAYSPNIGGGNPLTTDATGGSELHVNGWQDVTFYACNADGTSSTTVTQPTKKFLYVAVYGKTSGAGTGNIAAHSYEMRWVG